MNKLGTVATAFLLGFLSLSPGASGNAARILRVEVGRESHRGYRETHVVDARESRVWIDGVELRSIVMPLAIDDLRRLRELEPDLATPCDAGTYFHTVAMNDQATTRQGCVGAPAFRELLAALRRLSVLAERGSE